MFALSPGRSSPCSFDRILVRLKIALLRPVSRAAGPGNTAIAMGMVKSTDGFHNACWVFSNRMLLYFTRQAGSAYRISGFICIPTSNFQQTPDTETTLRFGKYTKFENISSDEFPRHDFNFVSYNQLEYKMHRKDTPTPQKQPTLTGLRPSVSRSLSNPRSIQSTAEPESAIEKVAVASVYSNDTDLHF
ncbi:hypothetical protein Tco_0934550 [Tanacetum coccineum]